MKLGVILILALALQISNCSSTLLCNACHSTYSFLRILFHSDLVTDAVEYLWNNVFCQYDKSICKRLFENNDRIGVRNVILRLDSRIMCPKLGFCASPRIVHGSFAHFQKANLFDKPPRWYPQQNERESKFKFVVFADAHFDLNYTQNGSTRCNSTTCCRTDSPPVKGVKDRPGKWGHLGDCNIPFRTVEHFVENLGDMHKDTRFVVWLGDNPDNAYYDMDKERQKRIFVSLTKKLLAKHPNIGDVYPVVGNHEGIPLDHMQMGEGEEHWPLEFLAELWSPWLSSESQETFRKYGRYSQLHPGTRLRIVAINSFVQDCFNSYLWGNITDAWGELAWLKTTLETAERRQEHVLIIGHIPPGNGFTLNEWAKRYLVLMDRFANIIRGQLFGHSHQDAFEVELSARPGEVAGVALQNPCLTAHGSLHPSYRVYHMDPTSHTLVDYEQFRLNLTEANRHDRPKWQRAYKFTEYYGTPQMEDRDFAELARRIRKSDAIFKKFAWMLFAEGPRSAAMMKRVGLKEQTYCKLMTATQERLEECLGGYNFTLDINTAKRLFNKYFFPSWEYAEA